MKTVMQPKNSDKVFFTYSLATIVSFIFFFIIFLCSPGTVSANTDDVPADANTSIGIQYRGHIQNYGNMPKPEGTMLIGPDAIGTRGQSLRIEGFWIEMTGAIPEGASLKYQVHVENLGWLDPVSDGAFAGTSGRGLRVESIRIWLENLPGYDICYRGHVQNRGDLPLTGDAWGWVENGAELGTTGSGLRLEELQVKLVKQEVNLSRYQTLLDTIAQLQENDYAADTWRNLQAVLAENAVSKANIQAEIDTATATIQNAYAALVTLKTFDQAGTYGPEIGLETLSGDVTIKASRVVLQNMLISRNLTIAEEVGDGDVTLNNVTVLGQTFIRGGGINSIHINAGQYHEIVIERTPTGAIRVVATDLTGATVIIDNTTAGEEVLLEGDFDRVSINASDVIVKTRDGLIASMTVSDGAKNCEIQMDYSSTVGQMVFDEAAAVKGQGTINQADVNADGVTYQVKPENQTVDPAVTEPPVVVPVAPGGGGGSSTTPVTAIAITGTPVNGQNLTAEPTPAAATGSYQWLRSDSENGVYSAIPGLTEKTYSLISSDAGKYYKVQFIGAGSYSGTVTSAATHILSFGATLRTVFGQVVLTGLGTGTPISPIQVNLDVENSQNTIQLADITADVGATVKLFSDSNFATETSPLTLTSGSATKAYLRITSEDTTSARHYELTINRAATPTLAGVQIADDSASSDKTSITMPALPSGSAKFLYLISSDDQAVPTPDVGADWSAHVANQLNPTAANLVTAANGKNIGIAAVDSADKVIQFVNISAVVAVNYTAHVTITIDGVAANPTSVALGSSADTPAPVAMTASVSPGVYTLTAQSGTRYLFVNGSYTGQTINDETTLTSAHFTVNYTTAADNGTGSWGTVSAAYASDHPVIPLRNTPIAPGSLVVSGSKVSFSISKTVASDTVTWSGTTFDDSSLETQVITYTSIITGPLTCTTTAAIVATPAVSPASGKIGPAKIIELTTATSDATCYYNAAIGTTVAEPTTASTSATTVDFSTLNPNNGNTLTLKVMAAKTGYTNSAITTATYTWDSTPPEAFVSQGDHLSVHSGVSVNVTSNEKGKAYLVLANSGITTQAAAELAVTNGAATAVAITASSTATAIATTNLSEGAYKVVAADEAGNLSAMSYHTITIDDTPPAAPTVPTQTVNVGTAITGARSNELGRLYLVIESATVTDKASLDALVTASKATSAAVSAINTDISIATAGLSPGTYKVYAVDLAGNVSDPSINTVTVQ
ncbi:cadherin-like beta sandwich domain-containing protein [Acetobacterium wieringae]|uniref:cadherin-like beta sandwich domain-containing protein n=1 Tax=Acetobacterium wieringae TaxID=52694 RepID=UPI0026E9D838|nr:cadherin-like beta sandwich domain-containing protein [Acetobacterium wieringae]